jgi:hypothetical protein
VAQRRRTPARRALAREAITAASQDLDERIAGMTLAIKSEGFEDAVTGYLGALALIEDPDTLAVLLAVAIGRLARDGAGH